MILHSFTVLLVWSMLGKVKCHCLYVHSSYNLSRKGFKVALLNVKRKLYLLEMFFSHLRIRELCKYGKACWTSDCGPGRSCDIQLHLQLQQWICPRLLEQNSRHVRLPWHHHQQESLHYFTSPAKCVQWWCPEELHLLHREHRGAWSGPQNPARCLSATRR